MLKILFENDDLVAIHKPHGLLVHKSKIAKDATTFAVQQLRNQLGQRVYPVHRLDRKTAGVLLFAKSTEANRAVQNLFRDRLVQKKYHAILRGYAPATMSIDYDLTENDKTQSALTDLKLLETFEIPLPFGKHKTSRYSLVELTPKTGRFHQLRKHMAHIRHPILGDRPHGCNKQNKLWKEKFNMTTMMLCAISLNMKLPEQNRLKIKSEYSSVMHEVLSKLRNG